MGTIKQVKITVTLDELRKLGISEEIIDGLILADKKRDEAEDAVEGPETSEQQDMLLAERFANGGNV